MRKESEIILIDRGKELSFLIKEMPASKLEKWLIQVVLLLSKSENQLNEYTDYNIISNLITKKGLSLLSSIDFNKAEPLFDELLSCVHRKVDNAMISVTAQNIDTFIEDVETLFRLRLEVLKLNLSFFTQEESSITQEEKKQAENTFDMRISQAGKLL